MLYKTSATPLVIKSARMCCRHKLAAVFKSSQRDWRRKCIIIFIKLFIGANFSQILLFILCFHYFTNLFFYDCCAILCASWYRARFIFHHYWRDINFDTISYNGTYYAKSLFRNDRMKGSNHKFAMVSGARVQAVASLDYLSIYDKL